MKLLIIDDCDDDVLLARKCLPTDEVRQAAESREALHQLSSWRPDFCLVDFNLADSHRMIYRCALHQIPAAYWTGLPCRHHRMFLDKSTILNAEEFRKRLLELIDGK